MINGFMPQSPLEKAKTLKSFRSMFIEDVTNGKKKSWRELTIKEKILVDVKCLTYYNTLQW